jgi:hypothetical protein
MNGLGPYGYAGARAISQWQDVVHFTPIAVEAAKISAWGIFLHLEGSLQVTNPSALINAEATVRFEAGWGAGSGAIPHEIHYWNAPKLMSYNQDSPTISSGGVNPFDPKGIFLIATLQVDAYSDNSTNGHLSPPFTSAVSAADFAHTAGFPGIVGLDANGNILPDASRWVTVTTDSGVEIPILSAVPTAVPEPSSLVMAGMEGIAIACLLWRRRPRR